MHAFETTAHSLRPRAAQNQGHRRDNVSLVVSTMGTIMLPAADRDRRVESIFRSLDPAGHGALEKVSPMRTSQLAPLSLRDGVAKLS